ncbi:MAG: WXG100 family type VII secretion target [Thermocrispum sp.]
MAIGNQLHSVTESLHQGATVADSTVTSIQGRQATIQGNMDAVCGSSWMGSAPAAAMTVHQEWNATCTKLNAMLNEIGINTRTTANENEAMDVDSASGIMQVMSV